MAVNFVSILAWAVFFLAIRWIRDYFRTKQTNERDHDKAVESMMAMKTKAKVLKPLIRRKGKAGEIAKNELIESVQTSKPPSIKRTRSESLNRIEQGGVQNRRFWQFF